MSSVYPGLRRSRSGEAFQRADFQSRSGELRFQRNPFIDLEPFRRVTPKPPRPPLRYTKPPRLPPPPRGMEWVPGRPFSRQVIGRRLLVDGLSRIWPAFKYVRFAYNVFELSNLAAGKQAVPALPMYEQLDPTVVQQCTGENPTDVGPVLWAPGPTWCIGGIPTAGMNGNWPASYEIARRPTQAPVYLHFTHEDNPFTHRGHGVLVVGPFAKGFYTSHFTGMSEPVMAPPVYLEPALQPARPRYPQLQPEDMPINGGVDPTPLPIPYRLLPGWKPDPLRIDQTVRGHGSSARALHETTVGATYEISSSADPHGPPSSIPPEHTFTRPPRRTREAKRIATPTDANSRVALVFGASTEVGDVIDVLMDALPSGHKRPPWLRWKKHLTLAEKLQAIAYNWRSIDWNRFSHGLVENQVEDFAFGRVGRGLRNLNRHMGRPVGVQTGPAAPGKVPDGTQTGPAPWQGWSNDLW